MKLTETITIQSYVRRPGPISAAPSIRKEPITTLIDKLGEHGISINTDYSQAEVHYTLEHGTSQKTEYDATVPLENPLADDPHNLRAYILRDGEGLELTIENFSDVRSRGGPGVIGGGASGSEGIKAYLTIEKPTVNIGIVEKVKESLKATYDPKYQE